MLRLKLLPGVCLFSIHLFAQPVITKDKLITPRSFYNATLAKSASPVDTSKQGANVSWDFSGIKNAFQTYLNVNVLSWSQTNKAADYSGCNYTMSQHQFSSDSVYFYYRLNDSALSLLGTYNKSFVSQIFYTKPHLELVFPFTYGKKYAFESVTSIANYYTSQVDVVGYGSVKMPDTTYNNVLMARITTKEISNPYANVSYKWYTENGIVIINYQTNVPSTGNQPILYYAEKNVFVNGVEDALSIRKVSLANPVGSELRLNFETDLKEITYGIYNQLGMLVLSGQVDIGNNHNAELREDISGLAPGIYFIQLTSADQQTKPVSLKFVKQ